MNCDHAEGDKEEGEADQQEAVDGAEDDQALGEEEVVENDEGVDDGEEPAAYEGE